VKVRFWLLDISYQGAENEPQMWMWGITSNNERVLIIDKNIVAYFYAVLEQDVDSSKLVETVKEMYSSSIVKAEPVEKKFFGRPVTTIKICVNNPNEVSRLAKQLRTLEGVKDCLEDDIRMAMRYLIDNNIVPCAWHEAEVAKEQPIDGVRVDKILRVDKPPRTVEEEEVPQLRLLSFSMICYSREGSPKAFRNPVIILSTTTNAGEERKFLAEREQEDIPLLQSFHDYVVSFDPDIIVGYGTNSQDWEYLKERYKQRNLRLNIDRTSREPHTSVYGHVSLSGMINLDLADFIGEFPEVKLKNLQNFADHLGVMSLKNRLLIEDVDFPEFWDNVEKRQSLVTFSTENTRCVLGIADLVLDFGIQLSSLVCLPLDHVMTAAAGFRVEWFIIRQTSKIGELVPKRIEQPYLPYVGGIVLKPTPGLHENIAVLDFKSMYPNIMITYNLSPDTYIPPGDISPPEGYFEAPEVNHRFRKAPPGFYKEILQYLIKARSEIRGIMKTLNQTSSEYRVLNARQKAVKIITNAAYGYAGWVGARWYNKPVAEAASAWGRHSILNAVKMAEEAGLRVIYGDTDSLFVTYDLQKTKILITRITRTLNLDIDLGQQYVRVFFTEAKKRYVGLLTDGTLDIVGLEVIRGDWAGVARTVQEQVLDIILKGEPPERAAEYVKGMIEEVRNKKVPFRDLVIWKSLSKPVEEYAIKAAHVEAAKLLRAKGWHLTVGDKVGFVVRSGEGRLYERIKPYFYATYDDIDLEYYVSKQVVPAAVRILGFFGINEEDLLIQETKEKQTKSLMEYFGA
jgi:DNA polymerase, archaea type